MDLLLRTERIKIDIMKMENRELMEQMLMAIHAKDTLEMLEELPSSVLIPRSSKIFAVTLGFASSTGSAISQCSVFITALNIFKALNLLVFSSGSTQPSGFLSKICPINIITK